MKNNEIIVSVCMITYNHEKFINEAIEGVLMQKTNFPIELIISEDCSTDNTRKIVLEYADKYPNIIRPLLPEKNLGMMNNFIVTMQTAIGKYIALCEGDDYWTDPYKLQKQVDFLEANKEFSMCFHPVKVLSIKTNDENLYSHLSNREYSGNEVLEKWTIPTCSVVFRNTGRIEFPEQPLIFGDIFLFLLLNEIGKLYCIDLYGATYRRHSEGISVKGSPDLYMKVIDQYKFMIIRFPQYKDILEKLIKENYKYLSTTTVFKGSWKVRLGIMKQNPKLFYKRFCFTTIFKHMLKMK